MIFCFNSYNELISLFIVFYFLQFQKYFYLKIILCFDNYNKLTTILFIFIFIFLNFKNTFILKSPFLHFNWFLLLKIKKFFYLKITIFLFLGCGGNESSNTANLSGQVAPSKIFSTVTHYAASRFLEHASMGPSTSSVAQVKKMG